jgi:hypothetical protein
MPQLCGEGRTGRGAQDVAEDLWEGEESAEEEVEDGDGCGQEQAASDGEVEIFLGDAREDLRETKTHIYANININ